MTAYFNMHRPKESGIEVYEEDLPENQDKNNTYTEEEEPNKRPKFLTSGKKSFVMLPKEEQEEKLKQSKKTAKAATKPLGPVIIGKKIYEKGKAIAKVPEKIKESAKNLFLAKKQKEEMQIKKEAYAEREKHKLKEKYKLEAKEKSGETFQESKKRGIEQNKNIEKFNEKIQQNLEKKQEKEKQEQERKQKAEKRDEKQKNTDKMRTEREERLKKISKANLEKIKTQTKLAKIRMKENQREKSESAELKKKDTYKKEQDRKANEQLFKKEQELKEAKRIKELKEGYYSGRDMEAAKRYIKDHPELNKVKGGKFELQQEMASAVHKGEDLSDIDWQSYSAKDKPLKETRGDEQKRFFDEN